MRECAGHAPGPAVADHRVAPPEQRRLGTNRSTRTFAGTRPSALGVSPGPTVTTTDTERPPSDRDRVTGVCAARAIGA